MKRKTQTLVMDLERLNRYNSDGCPACHRKFSLGDPVVAACGAWDGGAKLIHANEAVFDPATGQYIERRCYKARFGAI